LNEPIVYASTHGSGDTSIASCESRSVG